MNRAHHDRAQGNGTWRLVRSGHSDGYTNMALDEAIMWAVGKGTAPPTLRFYGWQPPAVSLGYFQELEESIDRGEIHKRGWGLVRRPTGGRAILHDDEVTYSVCLPQQLLPQGDSVVQSYRELSRGIEAGLQLLGVAAELGAKHDQQKRTGRRQPVICFAQTARVDMTVAGRKIVGSAQVRRDGIILQHGSIPLTLDWAAHLAVMPPRDSSQGGPGLRQAAVPVADAVERPVSFDEVCEALIAGFSEVLGIAVAETPLTPQEQQRAARLRAEKYATDAWNLTPPSRR